MFTVQCDFDDTITIGNVSLMLREAFAPPEWRQLEAKYVAGKFSVEESNRQQFLLIKAGKQELQDFVDRTVVVRRGFQHFVDYCRRIGIEFVIVSSGLDLYIEPVLRKLGLLDLERYSARTRVTEHGVEVDYLDPQGKKIEEGIKTVCQDYLKQRGQPIIYLGDGLSDIKPALSADYVIARGGLEKHFSSSSLPHFTFNDFYDVHNIVTEHIITRKTL